MSKYIFSILAVFCFLFAFGQTKTAKTSVYFQSDKHTLDKEQSHFIDTLCDFMTGKEVVRIIIRGNTDSDADSSYNLKLSMNRASTVQQYMEGKKFDSKLFKTEYFGESKPIVPNLTDEGKQANRRVDIIVSYKEIPVADQIKEIVEKEKETTSDSCSKDTVIYLPQGSRYVINRCAYLKYRDCIKIEEFLTPQAILASGFSTRTTSGEQLISGGMFRFDLCSDSNLEKPIIINMKVPVPYNGKARFDKNCGSQPDYKQMKLWELDENGTWRYKDDTLNITRSNDSLYYEFTVSGVSPLVLNLDFIMKFITLPPQKVRTRIKTSDDIILLKVSLIYPDPLTVYNGKINRKGTRARFKLPICPKGSCDCIYLQAKGLDPQNNSVITLKCLKEFDKKILFGKCQSSSDKIELRLLGFIPIREKRIYRKYFIKAEDWEK